jgi:hypothetical protein
LHFISSPSLCAHALAVESRFCSVQSTMQASQAALLATQPAAGMGENKVSASPRDHQQRAQLQQATQVRTEPPCRLR